MKTTDFPFDSQLIEAVEAAFDRPAPLFVAAPKAWVNSTRSERMRRRPKSDQVRLVRMFLAQRDGAQCAYCGELFDHLPDATLDHVIPKQIVKHWGMWNLVLSCEPCNTSKDNQVPAVIVPILSAVLYRLATLNAERRALNNAERRARKAAA